MAALSLPTRRDARNKYAAKWFIRMLTRLSGDEIELLWLLPVRGDKSTTPESARMHKALFPPRAVTDGRGRIKG
eukprot:48493-Hanusia_phi.AAC.1